MSVKIQFSTFKSTGRSESSDISEVYEEILRLQIKLQCPESCSRKVLAQNVT